MARWLSRLSWSVIPVTVLVTSFAHAADDEDEPDESSESDDGDKDEKAKDEKSDEKSSEEKSESKEGDASADSGSKDNSPVEESGKTYRFVGLRYRGIVVPAFIQQLFAEGGRTVYVHGFGPEFSIRKDNFEYNLSPWLAFYSMDDTAFKGKSDPKEAWELISSNIKILYLTSDFIWSHPLSPEFAVNYGAGAGLGIVFGDLHRVQSYPTAVGQDPNDFSKCAGVGNPNVTFCDNENKHFGNYTEPSWANGGSKPNIFPWLAVQTGFRYKPSRQFVARLDVGFGLSGFFFGLGADYGL